MTIVLSKQFKKFFKKRIAFNPTLISKYESRLELFMLDTSNPILRDHSLKGEKKSFRSFSITGDIRVIYYIKDGVYVFLDVGSHNQVYQ